MVRNALFLLLLVSGQWLVAATQETDSLDFDDTLLEEALEYPDWFEIAPEDLGEAVAQAKEQGKQGIMVYFGQKRCAYCGKFLNLNLQTDDIVQYLRKHFDVIPIDIWGINDMIDTDGTELTEREYALKYKTNFTPSLIFYDLDGRPIYRLRGYHPPYKFRAALEYVVEKFYQKESFRDYLKRAEPELFFYADGLTERDFFVEPPYDLQKLASSSGKPTAVFFEKADCHACELLHTGPLSDERIIEELKEVNAVQLNMNGSAPVTTPGGKSLSAKEWADGLGLIHAPAILFFDEHGNEVMRIDSIVQFYRLWGVLDYINRRGYESGMDYQLWRLNSRKTSEAEEFE